MLKALLSQFRRFHRDRRGAVAVLIAVAIVPLIAMVGVATDSARGFYARSRLSSAVDAAALAGGQVYFQNRRVTDARQFFDANFPPGFMDSTITRWDVHPDEDDTVSSSNKVFTVRASAQIPTTFMRLFGKQTMTVSSYAEVTRESKALDVVLAIDMSTSMDIYSSGGQSRLEAAKDAAKQMVGIMFGDNENSSLLRMGIVPWAAAVNVMDYGTSYSGSASGSYEADFPTELNRNVHEPIEGRLGGNPVTFYTYKTREGGSDDSNAPDVYDREHKSIWTVANSGVPFTLPPEANWKGCVWARWEPHLDDDASDDEYNADIIDGLPQEWPAWSPMGPETHTNSRYQTGTDWGGNPTYSSTCAAEKESPDNSQCMACPSTGILRLQNSKSTAENAIEGLDIGSGSHSTNIPQGLAWAWRVLSPEAPYEESATFQEGYEPSRAIVLLTDGQATAFAGDSYNGDLPGNDGGIGGHTGPTVSYTFKSGGTHNISQRDKRLIDLANNIKAVTRDNGEPMYEIYTILFGEEGEASKRLMREIATEPNSPYYYAAPDAGELETAFSEIGNHLSNLRLSK